MLHQQPSASHGETEGRASQPLYTRPMPGGGEVRVELLVSDRAATSSEAMRGRVVMERRARLRQPADAPVVLEEISGSDANDVVGELFRIARDNAAIARRILRQQSALRAD